MQIYKPWIVQLPGTAELLIVAFCPMGFGPGQCTFRNGTASEHAIFWRSSDSGASWSREGEDRVDVRGREFSLSVLQDGTLLMPSGNADCHPGCPFPTDLWRSTDSARTWSKLGLRMTGVGWGRSRSDRTVIELDGEARLGMSCSGDFRTKPIACAKNTSSWWRSNSSGASWDMGTVAKNGKQKYPPIGTVGHPDTQGWDDNSGFFGQSTIVLRNSDNRTLVHTGRLNTAEGTAPGAPRVSFDEYDGMFAARSSDGGASFQFIGCREGAGDYSIPEEHPHPQCAGLPSFGTVGEHYGNLLELADGRLLLTFTVRCGMKISPKVNGKYWCNGTYDGRGLGLRGVLSTDSGVSFAFDSDRAVIMEQRAFPSPQPSGGGYGNTVQMPDGALVTVGSWRDPSGAMHAEAVRWRLPPK